MKIWIAILMTCFMSACKTKEAITNVVTHSPDDYSITAEAYLNVMPMSDNSSPYLVIVIKPKADTLSYNFKINKLVLEDGDNTVECSEYDNDGFFGKGLREYRNTARDLGNIKSGFTMKLELVDQQGNFLNFRLTDIPITHVH